MPRPSLLLLGAVVVTVLLVAGGVAVHHDGPVTSTPEPQPVLSTPLADVDTTVLTVPRTGFCDAVDPVLVNRALGRGDDAEDAKRTEYANGQEAALPPTVRDVAHEFGCTWQAGDAEPAIARAWVFAPPVDAEQAADLTRAAKQTKGCDTLAGEPDFGDPSVALLCPTRAGRQASYRGLFGDAWLSCTLTDDGLSEEQLRERAGEWCAAVALAISA